MLTYFMCGDTRSFCSLRTRMEAVLALNKILSAKIVAEQLMGR